MRINQTIIDEIKSRNKISDYLISKGFNVSSIGPEKFRCVCPIHKENEASFTIYSNNNTYETAFCFGCKRSYDIIGLYSELERKSWKESLQALGNGIELSDDEEIELMLKKLKEENNNINQENTQNLFAMLSLNFSILGHRVLEGTEYDNEVLSYLEDIYQYVDHWIWRCDLNALDEGYNILITHNVLKKKWQEWKQKQEAINIEKLKKKFGVESDA